MNRFDLFNYWRDAADVVFVTALLWAALLWLRRSRALFAFLGLAILGAVYLAARQLGLELTAWIFQGFSAVLLVLIVVVFQDELRRVLERIGAWGVRRRRTAPSDDAAGIVQAVVSRLVQDRVGALLVLPGEEPVDRHLEGGVPLDGRLSEALLLSLFDVHSPGHDGAVVLSGGRAVRFGVHLPLSVDHEQLGARGTRHAAALGLAERSDALAIVVSEERGTVSAARDGVLRTLDSPNEVGRLIREFEAEKTGPEVVRPGFGRRAAQAWPYPLVALLLAAGLWLLLVPGSTVVSGEREARVVVENLPPEFELESVEPPSIRVTLEGPRRQMYFGPSELVHVRIDALLAQLGRRTFPVGPEQVEHPPYLKVLEVAPRHVRISLRPVADRPPGAP